MDLLLKGLALGLTLTIMVGPITFTIIHSGFERGAKAGVFAALGTWTSDLLFILACFTGAQTLSDQLDHPGVRFWLSICGGFILTTFGLVLLLSKKTDVRFDQVLPKHLAGYWTKGFIINSINPFTVFIWVSATLAILPQSSQNSITWFYTGIMTSLILGDTAKAFFAHAIRKRLNPKMIRIITHLSGGAFILFGLGLFVRLLI